MKIVVIKRAILEGDHGGGSPRLIAKANLVSPDQKKKLNKPEYGRPIESLY